MPGEDEGGFGGGHLTRVPGELKRWADAIKATTEAIEAVSGLLDAPRSAVLEVNNATSQVLRLQGVGDHDWGGFREAPPFEIQPEATGLFTSESNRPLTGTQGNVQYEVGGDGTVFHLEWNIPFMGGNESLCRVQGTNVDYYVTRYTASGGNTRVHMRYMIGEKARANPKTGPDWQTCGKCRILVSVLDEGRCAARPLGVQSAPSRRMRDLIQGRSPGPDGPGEATAATELFGKHEPTGYVFRLPFGVHGPNREGAWRTCAHCRGLFFDGWAPKGACPGRRGGHVAEGGGHEFRLVHGVRLAPLQQDNWRFCEKCYGLFYLPHNADAVCAGGGNHQGRPENYLLDHDG